MRTPEAGPTPAQRIQGPYFPFIDGLRAIAVLAVIGYHLHEPWLPGGFTGVDVFFVISGFVVSASVSGWQHGGVSAFFAYFYARRIRRILPALLACLLLTAIASMLFIPHAWLSSANDWTGLFASFGLSNLFLAFHDETYFAPVAAFNPYLHTWSLGVEEQFYLLFPLLFFAWTRNRRGRRLSMWAIAVLGLLSLVDAYGRTASNPSMAFYLTSTRFWELAAGVLLFQLLGRQRAGIETPRAQWIAALAAWLFLALMATGFVICSSERTPFPEAWMPVLATAGLIACLRLARDDACLKRVLASRLPRYIGTRSYSLYLWHWPVFVVLRWTSGLDHPVAGIGALLLTFALAETSYRCIEQPLRRTRHGSGWPRQQVIAAGLALMACSAVLTVTTVAARKWLSLSTVSRNPEIWYPRYVSTVTDRPGCTLVQSRRQVGSGSARTFERAGCSTLARDARRIFAIGDSHTLSYMTLLSEYALRSGATLVVYPNLNCNFATLQGWRETPRCNIQNRDALADIQAHARSGDVLFLASLRLDRLSDQWALSAREDAWPSMSTEYATQDRLAAAKRLRDDLEPLAKLGMAIVFEAPKPLFHTPPFRCSDAFNAGNPICRFGNSELRARIEAYRQPVLETLEGLAQALHGHVWDPLPGLCEATRCVSTRGDKPLFFDGDHLSAYGNDLLYPSFAAMIDALPQAPSAKSTH